MQAVCARAVQEGFEAVAFGDLFLEDIRAYRIEHLAGTGLEPVFPIWGIPTDQLAQTMVASGLRARITCLDPRKLSAIILRTRFRCGFSDRFAASVDPCGERGEFHSFAYAGPMFSQPIAVEHTHNVEREGFVYGDLVLAGAAQAQ